MPDWAGHVMWWHLYPLGFVGAPIHEPWPEPSAPHALRRLEGWLDHVVDLGLNGIALGPVFASRTHGYDTVDHFRIDPRLGDENDFSRLVDAAHARGLRVLLDGVFNHVGREHPAFQERDGRGKELFAVGDDGTAPVFEGHDQLVVLDHSSPAVENLVVDVMTYWLERGADGWRLDAAYAMDPRFWARVLPRVRTAHPEAWFVGEVIHGDYRGFVETSGVDSLTQYELWQGIWHSLADRNLYELAHALGRHNELLDAFVPMTFVGNHDVTRIASAVGPELVGHALAVLFTVAGTPSVYAGDEYAWTGVKEERVGGDDAVRPAFPDRPPAPDELSTEAAATLRTHQLLIGLRRQHPWLESAHVDVVHVDNQQLVLRSGRDEQAVLTALNLADVPADLPGADATHVVAGEATLADGRIHLPARGWAVALHH